MQGMRWATHPALKGVMGNALKFLAGKPEGMRPFGRPRCGWDDNIKIDIKETECEGVDV